MATERGMSQTAGFQETLRRLAIFDERLAGAGFGPQLSGPVALDGKTAGLLQVAASVALG